MKFVNINIFSTITKLDDVNILEENTDFIKYSYTSVNGITIKKSTSDLHTDRYLKNLKAWAFKQGYEIPSFQRDINYFRAYPKKPGKSNLGEFTGHTEVQAVQEACIEIKLKENL